MCAKPPSKAAEASHFYLSGVTPASTSAHESVLAEKSTATSRLLFGQMCHLHVCAVVDDAAINLVHSS